MHVLVDSCEGTLHIAIVHPLNNSHLIEVNSQNSVVSLQQQCSGLHCHIWYMYSVYRKNDSEITKVVTKTKVCYRFQQINIYLKTLLFFPQVLS